MHPGRLQLQRAPGHVDHLHPLRDALVLQPPSPGFRVSVRVGFPLNFLVETWSRESDNKGILTHNWTILQPHPSLGDSLTLSLRAVYSLPVALPLSPAPIDHRSSAVNKVSLGFQSRNRPRSFKLVPPFQPLGPPLDDPTIL